MDATGVAVPGPVLRVLVAEDDETLRFLSRRFTEKLGHTVTVVPDGRDAVDAALVGDYDVVLMDVHMPLMGGPQATRLIRAAGDRIRQPHIIALTAAVTTAVRTECRTAGMDAFVTKPFTSRDLRRALAGVPATTLAHPAVRTAPEAVAPTAVGPEPFAVLAGFDQETRAEVLRTFREHGTADVQRLVDALSAGDHERARSLAHRLRGSGAAIGASALADVCAAIETDPVITAPAADRIAALRAGFDAVVGRIEAIERGHAPS